MDLIPSFQIDHTNLRPGIYVSRQDKVGGEIVTTYDIRMTAPNHEPALGQGAIHTIEHLVATYLRNDAEWKDSIIYWGPMGCLTGNYLIMKAPSTPTGSAQTSFRREFTCEEVRQLMIKAFQSVVDWEGEVPGAAPDECGNYLLHDLPMAKWEAKRYVERLKNDFHSEYPERT